MKADDFAHQENVKICDAFPLHFPPTRKGERLSGLWDQFDPRGLGYSKLEWREPGVEVRWWNGRANLTGHRACMERVLAIIQHVCCDQLPIVLEWVAEGHQRRIEDAVSKCALIEADSVLIESSAAAADRWRYAMQSVTAARGEHRDEAEDEGMSPYFDIFLGEELQLKDCTSRFAAPLHTALVSAGVGEVVQCGDAMTNEFMEGDADVCSEIVVSADDVPAALSIARELLVAAGIRVGGQLQYEVGPKLLFETYTATGWAPPLVASVIDDGRAYVDEVWSGGTPL